MSPSLSISSLFDYDKVEYAQSSDVHLDIILQAPEKTGEKRIPLHMILALDCSGSMSGQKIESVKNTVGKMIQHLTEDDTVGIIGFSDNVWEILPVLPMTSANKDTARAAVKKLTSLSMTNIEAALLMAMERAVTAEKDKICRIVMLTDGLPTTGICNREGLVGLAGKMNPQITLSTFGYGADYDPELLTSLSSMGKGNNFYIQSDNDCRNAFALELGGLLSTYAQNIKVTVMPSSNMKIKEVLSQYQMEEKGGYRGITEGRVEVSIDDIYFGEKKHVVLKLEIPKATSAVCARQTKVCDISIETQLTESKESQQVSAVAKIQYVKKGEKPTEPNKEVQKQLLLLEAARLQKEAKEKADAGDYTGAQVVLKEAIDWAGQNNWYEGADNLVADFSALHENVGNRFTYHTVGSKMAATNLRAYYSNRGSSAGTITGASASKGVYMSGDQLAMMQSFSGDNSYNGTDIKAPKSKDEDEEKKS